jgi:hypothetical protein
VAAAERILLCGDVRVTLGLKSESLFARRNSHILLSGSSQGCHGVSLHPEDMDALFVR